MPVLTVSEKTCPQVGFSRKRSMPPSSLTTTTPKSSGFSTRLRAMVASAPCRLWKAMRSVQVDVGERVAGDDDEGVVAQQVLGELDAAGRPGGRLLDRVVDVDAQRRAVAEVVADDARQEGEGDDRLLDAVPLQQLEDVLHARLADDGHHRLRLVAREGTQAGALAACHHDCTHGPHLPL